MNVSHKKCEVKLGHKSSETYKTYYRSSTKFLRLQGLSTESFMPLLNDVEVEDSPLIQLTNIIPFLTTNFILPFPVIWKQVCVKTSTQTTSPNELKK